MTGPVEISEGPFAGWSTWSQGSDPYESYLGPFCYRKEGERVRCAFQPRPEHLNVGGAIHGGALMSFADFALFAIANDIVAGNPTVTLTCNCEFVSAGGLEGWVEGEGQILRQTRSLIFVQGVLRQQSRPLLAFSGVLKRLGQ